MLLESGHTPQYELQIKVNYITVCNKSLFVTQIVYTTQIL